MKLNLFVTQNYERDKEMLTNKIWIDGLQVYRKLFILRADSKVTLPSNVNSIVSISGFVMLQRTYIQQLPFLSGDGLFKCSCTVANNEVYLETSEDVRNDFEAYVIIEYTKK